MELLAHPWVTGETASADKMTDASKKLSMFRVFKSKLEAKVFESFCSWSDRDDVNAMKKSALVERVSGSFIRNSLKSSSDIFANSFDAVHVDLRLSIALT